MRIVVEFERAEQHWNPDTGAQLNYLVFSFGGKTHRIECEEQDIIAAVKESQGRTPVREPDGLDAHAAALGRIDEEYAEPYEEPVAQPLDDEGYTPEQEELEREFGGDLGDIPAHSPFANVAEDPDGAVAVVRPKPPLSADAQRRQNIAEMLSSRPRSREKLAQEKMERLRAAARAPMRRSVDVDEAGNPIVAPRPPTSAGQPTRGAPTDTGDDDAFGQG